MRKPKKLLSIILTLVMLLSLMPTVAFAADTFTDTADHWAEGAIETWAGHGVLYGSDGEFRPNAPITRTELAAVLNRVMGYTATTDATFIDVPASAWYASDIAKLYAAGIMQGDGNGVMRPTANITREEAAVMIARAFSVEENAGNINPFPDAAQISGWASFLVDGMKAAGYVSGDGNGNFNPKSPITRAEVVTILDNIVDAFYNAPNEADNVTARNVVVRSTGVTLKNAAISGNLYITEGVADGDVTLDNVTVTGTTYVRGGGANSIHIIGGSFTAVILDSGDNTHIDITGVTGVERVYINNTGSVTHNGMTVTYDAATGTLTFGGTLDVVELNADGTATVTVGGVKYDVIPPEGTVSQFALAPGSVVKHMITNGAVNVTGTGKIDKMTVHDDGVVIDKSVNVRPQDIIVDDGVKITVADKDYTGEGKTLPPDTVPSGNSGNTTPTTYSLTLGNITGQGAYGTVSIDLGNPTGNAQGASVTIKATPQSGYKFVGWVAENDRKAPIAIGDAEYNFQITANTTYYAIFTGDGSATYPTEIATEAELLAIHSDPNVLTNHYKLLNNITLTSAWTPIGDNSNRFTGSFDGGGHTITFGVGVATATYTGLFGMIGDAGTVRNLTVNGDISVTATSGFTYIGGIVGYNWGTIENCAMLGSVRASGGAVNRSGGIAGMNGSGATISRSYSVGNVSASGTDTNEAGGIVGEDNGTTTSCYSTGNITASGGSSYNYAGGIAGYSSTGNITNCYATGAVSASGGDTYAGGIAGRRNSGEIINCVALNSSVTADSTNVGRVIGDLGGTNNRAIPMSGITVAALGDATSKDGATIGTGDVLVADYWKNTTNGIWKDVFATNPDDDKPWVVENGKLPTLYWQDTAPSLPAHFAAGARADNPILVSDAAGLAAIADGLGKHYKLIDNINVGTNWTPIGSTSANAFTGSLNGNGYAVTIGTIASGLAVETISVIDNTYVGLFGYIGAGGVVERLAVTGTLTYTGTDSGNVFIGGIAGYNCGTIKNCYTTASVSGTGLGARGVYAGGIAGYNLGMIENCYARGTVSGSGHFTYVGGIVGLIEDAGTVQNCVALNSNVTATGSGSTAVGRIVGQNISAGLTNNYGSTAMTRDPDAYWNPQANGLDGANCNEKPDDTTFWRPSSNWSTADGGTPWDFANIWIIGADNYPNFQ